MKILHYISGISPTIGGIEIFLINIYEEFKKNDHQIEVLTRFVDKDTLMYKMLEDAGIKVNTLDIKHLSFKNISKFKKRVINFFESHGDIDVLHSHGYEDPFVVSIGKKSGIKTIALHVHSYRNNKRLLNSISKTLFIHRNCKISNVFLACSKEVGNASYPSKYHSRISIVRNGINSKIFEFDESIRNEYRSILGLQNKFVVCHVGRFDITKNHSFLLDVFYEVQNKHSDARLLLIGDGKLKESIYNKCEDLNITDKIIFTGDREDVNNLLQAADVFVMPSFREGFGIVIIEAQAAGLRTIVAKDSISESVKVTGLVDFLSLSEDITNWSDTILKYSNGYPREKMSQIIKRAGYDNRNTAEILLNIYNQNKAINN